MKLETEHLYLREMTPDDFDALYDVLADSDMIQHYPYTFDEARVRNWINKNMERYRVFGLWAVCLKTTGEMIGAVLGYVCCIFVSVAQTDTLQKVAVPVAASWRLPPSR